MQENTLTDKFKDLPDSLTYLQACGIVAKTFLGRPLMLIPLVLLTAAAASVTGPYIAIASPVLGSLFAAKKVQSSATKAGVPKQLLPQQETAVTGATELLAQADESKKAPALRNEFMRKAVFYDYFLETLSADLNLSAQAREVQGKIESEIGAESPTGLECLRLVNRMNAVQNGTLALVFSQAARAMKRDPQPGFISQFEEAAGPYLGEAAFGGHADIYDVGLITEMRNYIRKTGTQPE